MNLSTLNTGLIFELLFISFVVSIITAISATKLAIRIGLLDRPNSEPHKQHKHPVPVSGGTALFLTILILLLIFRNHTSPQLLGLTASSFVVYIFALCDDYKNLNWKYKLGAQILATVILILSGTQTHLFDAQLFSSRMPPVLCHICDIGLTLFWVVFITNAFNLVDSADGVMIGLAAWAE